jgi:hypothetical protein
MATMNGATDNRLLNKRIVEWQSHGEIYPRQTKHPSLLDQGNVFLYAAVESLFQLMYNDERKACVIRT